MEKLRFDELAISEDLLRAVEQMGFTEATPIQSLSIPALMEGKDIFGQSQTGSGKTVAFAIPAIERVDESIPDTQVLVMCPTRELAMQVSEEFKKLLRFKKKVRVLPVYGGESIVHQIRELNRGVHIVVGTPGRIMDHLDRDTLRLDMVQLVVLDEADEMLDMGFRDDIEAILKETPSTRQTVFFSATMAKPIMELTKKYQRNPETIKIAATELTVPAIEQRYMEVSQKDKTLVLERLIDLYEPKLCLVFCNTKRKVDELVSDVQKDGFFAEAIHGDMRQAARTQVMNKFRQGIIQILVATDVAARGIDVENVEMVINYDVPQDAEYYVHRIGRTGRAGRKGQAFTLLTHRERRDLQDIEKYAKTRIGKAEIPTLSAIEAKKKQNFFKRIKHTIKEGGMDKYLAWIQEAETEGVSAEALAAALLKLEFHKQIAQEDKLKSKEKSNGQTRATPENMVRLFLTVGKKHKVGPKDLMGAIAGETGLEGSLIGHIDIYDKFSFVEIPGEYAERVVKKMKKVQIRGHKFNIDIAVPKDKK
jgi:ATP-dependent RNA helicase DeaD